MTDTFKGIVTADGKKRQLPYGSILDIPKSDPSLTVEGGFADAAVVGKKNKKTDEAIASLKEDKVDKPSISDDGKIPRAKEGGVEWVEVGQPTDGQTENAVTKWLDNHPEATTTVQDGAIAEKKISPVFLPWIKKDYVTPEMFGAVGDGEHDDTDAIKKAILYASENGVYVFLQNRIYILTKPITLPGEIKIIGYQKKRTSSGTGAKLRFKGIATGMNCITVGAENNMVSSRVRHVTISDIAIECAADNATKTSIISIGDVSGCSLQNLTLYNGNLRQTEFTESELEDPEKYCNYGIKFNGDSELLVFRNCRIVADIPVYSIFPPDFAEFNEILTICEKYGYANYFGKTLCGNTTMLHISMNQGLYGIKFIEDELPRLSGIMNLNSFRIEQLRRYLDANGKNITTNIVIKFNQNMVIPRNITISNGRIDGNGNGIYIYGSTYGALRTNNLVNFFAVSGIRQSYDQNYILDVKDISGSNLQIFFLNCNIYNGGKVYYNKKLFCCDGLKLANQANDGIYPVVNNLCVKPLKTGEIVNQARYQKKASKEYFQHFEVDIAAKQTIATFLTEIIYPRIGNKVFAFSVTVVAIGEKTMEKANIYCKYGIKDHEIDAKEVLLSITKLCGDDIIFACNSVGNLQNDKLNIYKYGEIETWSIFALTNNSDSGYHLNCEITIYTTEDID